MTAARRDDGKSMEPRRRSILLHHLQLLLVSPPLASFRGCFPAALGALGARGDHRILVRAILTAPLVPTPFLLVVLLSATPHVVGGGFWLAEKSSAVSLTPRPNGGLRWPIEFLRFPLPVALA